MIDNAVLRNEDLSYCARGILAHLLSKPASWKASIKKIEAGGKEGREAVRSAFKELEKHDPRKGRIVNLRYFAGLTIEETAVALEISVGTVEREWRFIRTWLQSELANK